MNQSETVPRGETMLLNVGPSHPSTHGVLRVLVELDGERLLMAEPDIGYLHRGIEKLCEGRTYHKCMPLMNRLDYLAGEANNLGFVLAVEKLLGVEVPKRAQYIRVIIAELTRIASHLFWLGTHGHDLGAMTPLFYAFREREQIMDLCEMVSGGRMFPLYFRIGGLAADLPEGFVEKAREFARSFPEKWKDYDTLLTKNEIWIERTRGVGIMTAEEALDWGWSGPMARGSGIDWDLRRDNPYSSYEDFDFIVPLGKNGDTYDRYLVRMEEMRQSMRIIRQALRDLPGGGVAVDPQGRVMESFELVDEAKLGRTAGFVGISSTVEPTLEGTEKRYRGRVMPPDRKVVLPSKEDAYGNIEGLMNHFKLIMDYHGMRPPAGEAYFPVEGGNGELGFFVVSDGSDRPYRVRCRPPCFFNMAGLHTMLEGDMVADVVATFGSINMIAGELDR
jgi:NADH-quinone oxidoreductase subunit D